MFGGLESLGTPLLILLVLWTLPWKGWALWLASRRGEKWWFIVILILNTLAILEIIYIFLIAKRQDHKEEDLEETDELATDEE